MFKLKTRFKPILILILPFYFVLFLKTSVADIYICKDENGQTVYKDYDCDKETRSISSGKIENKKPSFKDETEKLNQENIIFSDESEIKPPHKIKVHEVKIVTNIEDTLKVEVIYTYEHEIPAEEVKLFVLPNHFYWTANSTVVQRGKNVAQAHIGLSKNNMKKDSKTRSFTTSLSIKFEHYSPEKYNGVVWSKEINFNKNWKLIK